MKPLPPGNILQNIYIETRLKKVSFNTFLEIGSGNGYLSHLILSMGKSGVGCDLNVEACRNNEDLNKKYISRENYKVFNENFIEKEFHQKFDLVISAMVIEHLDEKTLNSFIAKIKSVLKPDGLIVFLVPSSMKFWGIEDEIAGHIKRYEYSDFYKFKESNHLDVQHIAGLTYPLSNWLFKISNRLIRRSEGSKLNLSQLDKTIYTGNRDVPYKTSFPLVLKVVLNKYCLYPLHLLQLMFTKNPEALVIYCELKKIEA